MIAKEPGWYPDPFTQGRYERYFDGIVWTDETHPEDGPPALERDPDRENVPDLPATTAEPLGSSRSEGAALAFLLVLVGLAAAIAVALWPVSAPVWDNYIVHDSEGTRVTYRSCGSVLAAKDAPVSNCSNRRATQKNAALALGLGGLALAGGALLFTPSDEV